MPRLLGATLYPLVALLRWLTSTPDTAAQPRATAAEHAELVSAAASDLQHPGRYLVYRDHETVSVVPLAREWTRIGRSLAADVRFDDPTVSRRHALIVRQADGVRVLDDRSLNGVFVNGERVEWRTLERRRRDRRRPLPPAASSRSPARRAASRDGRSRAALERRQLTAERGRRTPGGDRLRRAMAVDDRGPLPEGRHRQDDRGAHARRRVPPHRPARRWRSTSTRRATCRTTSTSIRTPSRRSPTCSPAARDAAEAIHDDIIPANLALAEAELCSAARWAAS